MRDEDFFVFPLTLAKRLGDGTPTAFLDNIPWMALLFKPFSSVLPTDFQYFGLFVFLCAGMQFYFGMRLCRAISDDRLVAVLGGLLFLLSPPFTWRAFGHFSLCAHWPILGTLLYLVRPPPSEESIGRYWPLVALCAAAAGLHPYIAAMVLAISWLVILRAMRDLGIGSSRVAGLKLAGSCLLATVVVMALMGLLFVPGHVSSSTGWGYHSMNLLALVDPQAYASLALPRQATGGGQYEGYNYLGLGVILLLAGAIVRRLVVKGDDVRRRLDPVICGLIVVGCLAFAASTKITFGPYTLVDLDIPKGLAEILGSFRASGRFFWPAYYLILLAILALALRPPVGWGWRLFVGAMVVVQFLDTASLRGAVHAQWADYRYESPLVDPVWERLPRHERRLSLLPHVLCDPDNTPGTELSPAFTLYAYRNGMSIDSFRAGRTNKRVRHHACGGAPPWKRDGLRDDTAYVLSPHMIGEIVALARKGKLGDKHCAEADQFILCSSSWDRPPGVAADLQGRDAIGATSQGMDLVRAFGRGVEKSAPYGRFGLAARGALAREGVPEQFLMGVPLGASVPGGTLRVPPAFDAE
ncbi:MAG: hypothetical protein HQL38_01735 [Alphaproteobacteria bacterium]|nr:hypothetical protein [Alphaproteobacteria bacterium]MBF0391375.1 hypothetical protein [Alphaproteobacteria bacterium]